jgi:O-antigen ligase
MSPESPASAPVVRQVRAEARRQTSSFASGMGLAFGILVAMLGVVAIVALDYSFGQAPHRVIKLLIGVVGMVWVLLQPRIGLFMIPVITPFLPWVPPLPIPGLNALNALVASVFITWAIFRVIRREPLMRKGMLTGPITLVMVLCGLSVLRGTALPSGFQYNGAEAGIQLFRAVITLLMYFMVLAMARGPRDRRILSWSIALGLLAEGAVTILFGRSGSGSRAVGSIGQSNDLGAFLAMFAVFTMALIPAVRNWFGRLVLTLAVLAGSWGVVLSVSRAAVVALAVGLFYVALRSSKTLTVLLVLAGLTSPLWAPDYLKERLTGTEVQVEGSDEKALEGSAQLRLDTWRAIVEIVSDHPLDGVGFAGLSYVLPDTGSELGVDVKDSSHNTFLRFLAEMGILGLLAFCWLLWRCWQLALKAGRAAQSAFDRQMAVGLGAATIALALSCAFGDRFFSILIVGNFWIACAIVNDILLDRAPDATPEAAPEAAPQPAR